MTKKHKLDSEIIAVSHQKGKFILLYVYFIIFGSIKKSYNLNSFLFMPIFIFNVLEIYLG
jgi:hypothetical protein